MPSLSKDKKLTGLVVIFIEKGSAKSACNLNVKMDKLQLNKIFLYGRSPLAYLAKVFYLL